jgi:hypothetical protein
MSRRRYISTTMSVDKALNRLASQSDFAALLYTWMIPHAEDDSTLTGDADDIASLVIPKRRDKSPEDVEQAIALMDKEGLVWRYHRADGKPMLQFPPDAFYRYQTYIAKDRRNYKDMRTVSVASLCPSAQQITPSRNTPDAYATNPLPCATETLQPTSAPTLPDVPQMRLSVPSASKRKPAASVDKQSLDDLAPWTLVADCIRDNVPAYMMGIPPVVISAAKERLLKLSGECVVKAITETIDQGKVNKDGVPVWKYAWAICDRWIEKGVKQVEDIEPLQRDWEFRKEKDKQAREGDTGAFAPLSDEDKQKADEITKQLAARLNINGKAVRK